MLFRTPSKGSCYLKRTATGYFEGPGTFGFHQSSGGVSAFLANELCEEEVKPSNAAQASADWGGRAGVEAPRTRAGTHLAALAGADPVVVARRLVLADETRLVHARRRERGRGARDQFLGAGALGLNRCGREAEGERSEKTRFITASPVRSQASTPTSAVTWPGQAHKASRQGGRRRGSLPLTWSLRLTKQSGVSLSLAERFCTDREVTLSPFTLKRGSISEERSDSSQTNRAVVEPGRKVRCSHRTLFPLVFLQLPVYLGVSGMTCLTQQ